MAPLPKDVASWVKTTIERSPVVIFSKTTCPYCIATKKLLTDAKLNHRVVEIDRLPQTSMIQSSLSDYSGIKTVPQVFCRGKFIGDAKKINELNASGKLVETFQPTYDYDLIVIGGGSGGLAASKEAASLGAKVALLDLVTPTVHGTKWGLGGTCVNVGCIPKKLMHQAALHGHGFEDAADFGWDVSREKIEHDWNKMVARVQDHIHSLNFGHKVALRSKNVTYLNALGKLKDAHTILATDAKNETSTITADKILLAMGERPRYPDIPGSQYAITSDDLFSLDYSPGRTLVVGASYVALECSGFLHSLGLDATVMVRSILLRGFDQQMANMIGDYMEKHGVKFVKQCVPTKIEQLKEGRPGLYRVHAKYNDGTEYADEFNTIIFAIGRDPCVDRESMEGIGIKLDKAGRLVCDAEDATSVKNVFAIGDISSGKPQLTPVAIQAGRLLAQRLYSADGELMDYTNVPTTVFTPIEYGACGLSEEDAIAKFGQDNVEVYHSEFYPLEWKLRAEQHNVGYVKLVCNRAQNDQVVGFHILSPNAGEITQGYAVAMKLGATKADFDRTVGIHPTCSETCTTLKVTKRSGIAPKVTGC